MRTLSIHECSYVSGAGAPEVVAAVVGVAGGVMAYNVAGFLAPFSTVVGTIGTGVVAGAACTLVAPVVGTVVCGAAGAVAGYFVSSTFFSVGSFFVGGAAAGLGTYLAMTR